MNAALVERRRVSLSVGLVSLVLHLPGGTDRVACVVACHGLGASKDSDKYLMLGNECVRAGLALALFDFRGSGESEGLAEAETTVASRVDDALAAVTFLSRHSRLDGRFGLLGSSMGGFVALHARQALGEPIPVVTWNAPASLAKLAARVAFEDTGLGAPFLAEFAGGRYAEAPAGLDRLLVIPGADHRITDPDHRRLAVTRSLAWFAKHLGA